MQADAAGQKHGSGQSAGIGSAQCGSEGHAERQAFGNIMQDDGKEQQDIAGKRRFSMFAVSFRLMTVNAGMGQNAIQHVEQQCSHGEACGHGHKVQPSPGCSRQFKSRAEQTPE